VDVAIGFAWTLVPKLCDTGPEVSHQLYSISQDQSTYRIPTNP
jgi:ubiquitin